MSKTIWFDMDGTIADFYSIENWLEKILAEDTSPYEECEPLFDKMEMQFLINHLRKNGYNIGVISYAPKNCTQLMLMMTEKAKRDWLVHNFPYADEIHITYHGIPKSKWMHTVDDVLVDDEIGNIVDWMENGGDAIQSYRMLYNFIA